MRSFISFFELHVVVVNGGFLFWNESEGETIREEFGAVVVDFLHLFRDIFAKSQAKAKAKPDVAELILVCHGGLEREEEERERWELELELEKKRKWVLREKWRRRV